MDVLSNFHELKRKISIAIIGVMIASLMIPIVVAAAMTAAFTYDRNSGKLTGGIYVQDPSAVTISVTDQDSLTTTITPNRILVTDRYDNWNNQYTTVTYDVYVGQMPASVHIVNGSENLVLDSFNPTVDRTSQQYRSVTLDVYRMGGSNLLTLEENSYLAANSGVLTFIPVSASSDVLEIKFPYNSGANAKHINLSVSDFVIEDLTVSEAVHIDELLTDSSWSAEDKEYTVRLHMADTFVAGHEYQLNLSNRAGNKIKLPSLDESADNYTFMSSIGHLHDYGGGFSYIKENSLYFENLRLEQSRSPGGGGGGGGGGGIIPPADETMKIVNVCSSQNVNWANGTLDLANGTKQVLLPAHAAKVLGDKRLELKNENYSLAIPSSVLGDLADLASEEELQNACISFSIDIVADPLGVASDINGAGTGNAGLVQAAGEVVDLQISLITKDGKEYKLDQFRESIILSLRLAVDANVRLAGIYFINNDNRIEYVGGKVADGQIQAELTHFSRYAVLEYHKVFEDVAADYWAFEVIQEMAAKHVIAGVSDTRFAPQNPITRAQFAALLARALQLQASGTSTFTDVPTASWYADDVAAAAEAGIISGRSEKIFAPNEAISREEMASMIVRAHVYMTSEELTSSKQASFADADEVSQWAHEYVNAAYELGYMQGRGGDRFVPKGTATRAESAQVISLLVKRN